MKCCDMTTSCLGGILLRLCGLHLKASKMPQEFLVVFNKVGPVLTACDNMHAFDCPLELILFLIELYFDDLRLMVNHS